MHKAIFLGAIMLMFAIIGCSQKIISDKAPLEYVQAQLDKLAPVELQCNISNLSANEKQVLAKLVEAAKIMDELFLLQVNEHNPDIRAALKKSHDPSMQPYLDLFTIMFGPWNRLDHNKPFINSESKPAGASFYPPDMTKKEFDSFIADNQTVYKNFTNEFTVIQRQADSLKAVPYHVVYKKLVNQASRLLQEAADICQEPTLKKYLNTRAEALLSDDYFESDMAWMDVEGNIEIVIGPYEVYEDNLFGYKAAYESFVCVVDQQESEKLAMLASYLNHLEGNLPIPDKYKNFNRGMSSPIKVVQEVFSAGDTKAGIQTTAFNLPNDERVREAKGSKKVMLKNVAQAKYEKCWIPIVNTILSEKPLAKVSFDTYFNEVLMHEMSHGIGPGNITREDGTETTVGKELKELYSVFEECKADVLAIYNLKFLMDKAVFPDNEYGLYATYAGGMMRSIRFGINEAHGGGVAIQFNYYFEKGAFTTDENGKLNFDPEKMYPAVTSLANKLLMIQANGDYEGAKSFAKKYQVMSPIMKKYVDQLKDVPVDIRPSYPVLEKL